MLLGCHLKGAHLIGMSMLLVHLFMLMCLEVVRRALHLGEFLIQRIAMPQDMKDHFQVTVKGVRVIMILFPVLNALTVHWLVDMVSSYYAPYDSVLSFNVIDFVYSFLDVLG